MPNRRLAISVAIALAAAIAMYVAINAGDRITPTTVDLQALAVDEMAGLDFIANPVNAPGIQFVQGPRGDTPVTFADFRGKALLVNLWATWCAPCVAEMPALDRLEADMGGEDFQVVAISLDRVSGDVVRAFYIANGLSSLEQFADPASALPRALDAYGVPATVLIDRRGRMIARLAGPAEWDSAAARRLIAALKAS